MSMIDSILKSKALFESKAGVSPNEIIISHKAERDLVLEMEHTASKVTNSKITDFEELAGMKLTVRDDLPIGVHYYLKTADLDYEREEVA